VWPEMCEFAITMLAVIFCGAMIKLTDDYLDQEEDRQAGRWNWTSVFGVGTPVYAMLLLGFAVAIDTVISLSLFFASYVAGMFPFPDRSYPSRLRGWQEGGLILLASSLLLGWRSMFFALCFIVAIQLIDDCIDQKVDGRHMPERGNWANRFGTVECLLAAAIFLLTALKISLLWFWPTLLATTVLYIANLGWERNGLR
jgi:4-hydroxybenzoate polyprenyltransferase